MAKYRLKNEKHYNYRVLQSMMAKEGRVHLRIMGGCGQGKRNFLPIRPAGISRFSQRDRRSVCWRFNGFEQKRMIEIVISTTLVSGHQKHLFLDN